MSTGYIVRSTKPNGPVFEIVAFDPETKKARLKGHGGVEFPQVLSKDELDKYGYRVERAEASRA